MANVEVKCPTCGDRKVNKYGKSKTGEQRYLRYNNACHIKGALKIKKISPTITKIFLIFNAPYNYSTGY